MDMKYDAVDQPVVADGAAPKAASNAAHDQHQLAGRREANDAAARAGWLRTFSINQDSAEHRALFSLPSIKLSGATDLTVQKMPPQKFVTGDAEVDAVLWLREVISTGQADLIEKAKLAAERIKTPLGELETRYTDYLRRANLGNPFATLSSFGFANLDRWIELSVRDAKRRNEARARFGNSIFEDTPAEQFCERMLVGVLERKDGIGLDEREVDARFDSRPELRPSTLSDCLHELEYWTELYWLRHAIDRNGSESSVAAQARKDYAFRCLGRARPRSGDEAASVLHYLFENDCMQLAETKGILLNLVGAGARGEKEGMGGRDAD